MKKTFVIAVLGLAMAALCGCETLEDMFGANIGKYEPRYVISINTINKYPRGGTSEAELFDRYGKKITIYTNPAFHSANIKEIELLPRNDKPNTYDLELTLNPTGARKWMLMNINNRDDQMAIVIDGVYYGVFQPQPVTETDFDRVVLTGPFDEVWAIGLQKYAKKNFRHFTPNASSF